MRRIVTDWSPAEDLRPASGLVSPEQTEEGRVWRQITYFEWDGLPSYTQLTIWEDGDSIFIDHGRVWPVIVNDEDGG